jgi:hypothetical protein
MVINLITGVYACDAAFPHTRKTWLLSVIGKWAIDTTKPVSYREEERKKDEHARPIGWEEVDLK